MIFKNSSNPPAAHCATLTSNNSIVTNTNASSNMNESANITACATTTNTTTTQWAAGGFEEFLNIMNFYVFLIVWDNRVNKL